MTHMLEVTTIMTEALLFDIWPRQSAIVDFGIDNQKVYEAYSYAYLGGDITAEQLNEALGDGTALTKLLREASHNPHHDITITTAWDLIGEEV